MIFILLSLIYDTTQRVLPTWEAHRALISRVLPMGPIHGPDYLISHVVELSLP